jgi:hypothetical protein
MYPSRRVWFGIAALGLLACAEKDAYWTRKGADEQDFRRASRSCNEQAQIQAFEESRNPNCGFNTGTGVGCRRTNPNDPGEVQAEKNRSERRRRYLYGQCLEGRGWVRNYEGEGFKGR